MSVLNTIPANCSCSTASASESVLIYSKISGGLGNQLFQYAAGRALAVRHGMPLALDPSWFEHIPKSNTPRTFELAHYALAARVTVGYERLLCRLHNGQIVGRLAWLPRPWRHVREKSFDYEEFNIGRTGSVYLDGYWQSYRYFEHCRNTILAELTPPVPMSAQDQVLASMMHGQQAVSVHVRRGDYVSNAKAMQNHGVASLNYYRQAIARMHQRFADARFFVFSDDLEWARANLPLPANAVYVGHNGPENAFQDLRLMTLCSGHIIANSSFSWWGAWLSMAPSKHVIAPASWFADGRATPDLIPPDWERL